MPVSTMLTATHDRECAIFRMGEVQQKSEVLGTVLVSLTLLNVGDVAYITMAHVRRAFH